MKPNKAEREIVRMRSSLPNLTMEQLNWILGQDMERAIDEYAEAKKKVQHYDYYSVVTACEDWQVVRYFLVISKITRNGYTFDSITEVSQRWMQIEKNGAMQLYILDKPHAMFWHYKSQPYALSRPLSFKHWNTSYNRGGANMFFMDDCEVVPGRVFAKSIVKAKLDKAMGRLDEVCLYKDRSIAKKVRSLELCTDKVKELTQKCYLPVLCETLYKMGEPMLAEEFISRNSYSYLISRYWGSFLVAHRHGLSNIDWRLWFDYVQDLEKLGKDIRSPKYLVPEDIGVAHARLIKKLTEKREREEWDKVQKEIADYEPKYAKEKGIYFGIAFTTKSGLTISVAKSVRDVYEEGKAMHHCVYRMGYYKKAEDLLLFARGNDGKRVETIRINLNKLEIAESRGLMNKATQWHDEIVDALNENMWRVADAMKMAS